MKLRFESVPEPGWPRLAWIARCAVGDPTVRVRHGAWVEVRPDWLCEAVWDGDFDAGAFDQTDLIFGSGVRLREDRIVFVSAGSTVDRLHVLRREGEAMVSNSLACLLAVSGTEVDVSFPAWTEFFLSIKGGIDAYARQLPIRGSASIELVYFRNLVWDGNSLAEGDKPSPQRDFGSFAAYHGFLLSSVRRLAANMADGSRRQRYEMLGTMSSGYDAATSAAVCRAAGMSRVISARQARGGGGEDHGSEIAGALGLRLELFDRAAWRQQIQPEIPFFAANPRGGEVYLRGAEKDLQGKVLVTGFHGDKVWGKETKALGADVVRGDMSGLSLCEYRLQVGFIQFPLAFMGVRQIRAINGLSNSVELAPWDVPGDYSRPICRRILEEAGVPRETFGMRKKMASVHFGHGESLLTDRTRAEYHAWLRKMKGSWAGGRHGAPRVPSWLVIAFRRRYYLFARAARLVARPLPARARQRVDRWIAGLQNHLNGRINLPDHIFPWAVEKMKAAYRAAR